MFGSKLIKALFVKYSCEHIETQIKQLMGLFNENFMQTKRF